SLRRSGGDRHRGRQGVRARAGGLFCGRSAAHRRAPLGGNSGEARVPAARLRGAPGRPGGDGLTASPEKKLAALELAARARAAALCLRSGNAALLRGGSEALQSNSAIAECFPEDAVQLVPPDRELLDELLQLEEQIDLCIPRGGSSLIRMISQRARVPVI